MRVGLRGKLIFGTVSLMLGFVLAASGALWMLIQGAAERQVAGNLDASRRSYQNYMTLKWRSLRDNAEFLSRSSLVSESVSSGDRTAVAHVMQNMEVGNLLSFVWVGDATGQLQGATRGSPEIHCFDESDLARSLHGETTDGTLVYRRRLYLVAAAPIVEQDKAVGVLVVGEQLDEVAVHHLAEVTGRDVLLLNDDQVMAQAWRDQAPRQITAAEHRFLLDSVANRRLRTRGMSMQFTLEGRPRLGLAIPMQGVGDRAILILSNELDELTAQYDVAYAWLLGIGLTIGALGVLVSLRVAGRLTGPLKELISASDTMSAGELNARVAVKSDDEVGRLAYSFNRMASTIEGLVANVVDEANRAEAANRAKDSLLASMSHELRTPVAGVKAATEILLQFGSECSEQERQEFLQALNERAERLSWMITQVLDYALVESGRMNWKLSKFKVDGVISEVAEGFRAQAGERGVDLRVNIEGDTEMHGDSKWIRRVARNLLDNACRHTAPDTDIEISVAGVGSEVEIRFSDRGPGLPGDAAKAAIFDRFYQHGDPLTDKPAGTGLGLAISREVVLAHDGLIRCEDREGGGATFVVVLRREAGGRPVDAVAARENAPQVEEVESLLVEDTSEQSRRGVEQA